MGEDTANVKSVGEGPGKALAQGRCPEEQLSQRIHWDMEPSMVTDGFSWPSLMKEQLPLGNGELFWSLLEGSAAGSRTHTQLSLGER